MIAVTSALRCRSKLHEMNVVWCIILVLVSMRFLAQFSKATVMEWNDQLVIVVMWQKGGPRIVWGWNNAFKRSTQRLLERTKPRPPAPERKVGGQRGGKEKENRGKAARRIVIEVSLPLFVYCIQL